MGKYGKMGTLEPGAIYIYERVDNVVYARKEGSTDRFEIGRTYNANSGMEEELLWREIRDTAKTNTTLQEALDHVIMIYKLSKEYKDGI